MVTLIAFLVAIGILITIHELGHYCVARLCGVKVLKFSFGFGPKLFSWKAGRDQTEWQIAAIPLGGFVQMADEREENQTLSQEDRLRAFNRQSVYKRFAIVAAGPIANFLLAIVFFAFIAVMGQAEIRPVMAEPVEGSQAASLNIAALDEIVAVDNKPVEGLQDYSWAMLEHAGEARVPMTLKRDESTFTVEWDMSAVRANDQKSDPSAQLGIRLYYGAPILVNIQPDRPAALAGIRDKDRVLAVNGRWGLDPRSFIEIIKNSAERPLHLIIKDENEAIREVTVTPRIYELKNPDGSLEQRAVIGCGVGLAPNLIWLKKGPIDGVIDGFSRMVSITKMTLSGIGEVATGEAGRDAISGPVTIAEYAGKSAQMGWRVYLSFLAMISVSLGILNLLPVPLLDGGHLLYYVVEMFRGKPLPESVTAIGQKVGLIFIAALTILALSNDFLRLIQ